MHVQAKLEYVPARDIALQHRPGFVFDDIVPRAVVHHAHHVDVRFAVARDSERRLTRHDEVGKKRKGGQAEELLIIWKQPVGGFGVKINEHGEITQ